MFAPISFRPYLTARLAVLVVYPALKRLVLTSFASRAEARAYPFSFRRYATGNNSPGEGARRYVISLVVAVGARVDFDGIGLHDEIVGRIGDAVFVRSVVHHRRFAGEVVEGRRRGGGPL